MIKRIQSKLQSNQSVRVDLERERRKMANVSPRAARRSQYGSDRPMSSMSVQSSRTSQRSPWDRQRSFQSGKVQHKKIDKTYYLDLAPTIDLTRSQKRKKQFETSGEYLSPVTPARKPRYLK